MMCLPALFWLAVSVGPQDFTELTDQLKELERNLARLVEVRRGVREGQTLPGLDDMALARASRLGVLGGLDLHQAAALGHDARQVRDRLVPGFIEDLRLLNAQRAGAGDPTRAEPSGVLVLIRDLEEELRRESLRRLYRRGLPNPFQMLGLEGQAEDSVALEVLPDDATSDPMPTTPTTRPALDPWLSAESLFRHGLYEDALAHYALVEPAGPPERQAHVLYRMAECLRELGRLEESLPLFQKVAEKHTGTYWAQQAEWSASLVETLATLDQLRGDVN